MQGNYGFIVYETQEAAKNAIKTYEGTTVDDTNGKTIIRMDFSHKSKAQINIQDNSYSNGKLNNSNEYTNSRPYGK